MDNKLSEFIAVTGSDPGLARDLLESTRWNIEDAIKTYESLKRGATPTKDDNKMQSQSSKDSAVPLVRPRLQKTNAVDDYKQKRLKRGISRATDNVMIVNQARSLVSHDLKESDEDRHYLVETPEYTFVLPNLTMHPSDLRAFLEKDLIETSTMVSLEQAGRLNWWADLGACQRLWPLATTGDGNCLLHAASLGMWGFHDRLLTLRKALHNTLTNSSVKGALWRRWRWQQMMANKEIGVEFTDKEWQTEWDSLLKLASAEPRSHPGRHSSCCDSPATRGSLQRGDSNAEVYYESLEEFHVFVLAHVLQRPVVVVADTVLKNCDGEALAPIPFGGIYLPFECNPKDCHKSPLVLTYDAAHFSALVAMESSTESTELPAMIPLVGPDINLLPVHFAVDPGIHFVWGQDENDPKKFSNLSLTQDDKLSILRKHLFVECVAIPKQVANDGNDNEQDSKSSNGSAESIDGNKIARQISDGGKSDKEKSKMAKQVQSVAKQFGSIGKSMGKKLKNMGKAVNKDLKPGKRNRKLSVGSVTQSTRISFLEVLENREHVVCAKLSGNRAEYQQEMLKNYMASAILRFEQDREMKRLRAEELIQRAEQRKSMAEASESLVKCSNSTCRHVAVANLNYLCTDCYEQQKKKAIDMEKSPVLKRLSNYDNVDYGGQHNISANKMGTIVSPGNSKFYTPSEENLSYYSGTTAGTAPLRNRENQIIGHGVPLDLSNSTFYESCNNAHVQPQNTSNVKTLVSNIHSRPANTGLNQDRSRLMHQDQDKSQFVSRGQAVRVVNSSPVLSYGQENSRVVVSNTRQGPQMQVTRVIPGHPPQQHGVQMRNNAVLPPQYTARPHTTMVVRHDNIRTGYNDFDNKMDHALQQQCNIDGSRQKAYSNAPEVWSAGDDIKRRCKSHGCNFYGSQATDFLCSNCFKQRQKTLEHIEATRQTKL